MKKVFREIFILFYYLVIWFVLIAIANPVFNFLMKVGIVLWMEATGDLGGHPRAAANLEATASLLAILVPTIMVSKWSRKSRDKQKEKESKASSL